MPVDGLLTASRTTTSSSAQTVKSAVDKGKGKGKGKGKATELSTAEYQSIIESLMEDNFRLRNELLDSEENSKIFENFYNQCSQELARVQL